MTLVERDTAEVIRHIVAQLDGAHVPGVKTKYKVVFVASGMTIAASIDVANRTIRVSIPHLEYLWAASQLFYLLYDGFRDAREFNSPPSHADYVKARPQLDDALTLFEEKRCRVFTCDDATFDVPSSLRCCESDYFRINSISAWAMQFFVLHETAHGELGHSSQMVHVMSVSEEEEADSWAIKKYFLMCPGHYRSQCAFSLCAAMLSLFPPSTMSSRPYYPETHRRLSEMLFSVDFNDNDEVFLFLWSPLRLFMIQWGVNFESENESTSLAEKVIEYDRMLARHINTTR